MKHVFAFLTGSWMIGALLHSPPAFPAMASSKGSPPVAERRIAAVDEALLKDCCEKLENDKRRIYYLVTRNYRMSMQVKGIYARDNMLFFRLFVCNHSHLDYDVDSIRFYVADNRWRKNTPFKVAMLAPLYVYGNTRVIRGKSEESPVIVLPRFTLGTGKHLVIELLEKNGGRNLQLLAYNFTLLRSRLI